MDVRICDPCWVYCLWELEGDGCRRIGRLHGGDVLRQASWMVRITDLGTNSHRYELVSAPVRTWYFRVEPGRRYVFEVGPVTVLGEFLPVARSETVVMPPDSATGAVDSRWAAIRRRMERLLNAMGGTSRGIPGSPVEDGPEVMRRMLCLGGWGESGQS